MDHHHQDHDRFKKNFNVAFSVFLWISRGVIVPFRKNWGGQALGFPCLGALVVMILWSWAAQDGLMLLWVAFWCCAQLFRRIQSMRMSGQVHSWYDGTPVNMGRNEARAKLIYEPLAIGVLAYLLLRFYADQGLRPTGLPFFFCAGSFSLLFVALCNRTMWNRRMTAGRDAEIEGRMMMQDRQNRFGN